MCNATTQNPQCKPTATVKFMKGQMWKIFLTDHFESSKTLSVLEADVHHDQVSKQGLFFPI